MSEACVFVVHSSKLWCTTHDKFAQDCNRKLAGERDDARDWVRRMTRETQVLTCVYCGQEYPPGSPSHGSEVLTAHIEVCPKHPMSELKRKLAVAEARVSKCVACGGSGSLAYPDGKTTPCQCKVLESEVSKLRAENDNFRAKLEEYESQVAAMREVLELLNESPYVLDKATVPNLGVEAAPGQVVGTLHVGYLKYRKLQVALELDGGERIVRILSMLRNFKVARDRFLGSMEGSATEHGLEIEGKNTALDLLLRALHEYEHGK